MAKHSASQSMIREWQTEQLEGEVSDMTGAAATAAQVSSWSKTGCLGYRHYAVCSCTRCAEWRDQDAEHVAFMERETKWGNANCEGCGFRNWDCCCYCFGCGRSDKSRCKC